MDRDDDGPVEERGTGWNEPDSERQQLLDLADENERLRALLREHGIDPTSTE